jgi:large subunit ribosomal protein L31
MKPKIHPDYRKVLHIDSTNGAQFLIPSTVHTKEVGVFDLDGKEYPIVRVTISSAGHPVWTGKSKLLDAEGRLDKFAKKYQRNKELGQLETAKKEEADKAKAKTVKKKK